MRKNDEMSEKNTEKDTEKKALNILAVTSCPKEPEQARQAAEALKKTAHKLGHNIQVETRDGDAVRQKLTKREISEADVIIVAADAQVPMERFLGKKVIKAKTADGLYKAEELIRRVEQGDIKVFEGKKAKRQEAAETVETAETDKEGETNREIEAEKTGVRFGVSHMLPFLIGGGILIALAFLTDCFAVDLKEVPQRYINKFGSYEAVRENFGNLTPLSHFLNESLGGVAFRFLLPVLAGFIALNIGDKVGLCLGFLGGALAAEGVTGFWGALLIGIFAGHVAHVLQGVFSRLPKTLGKHVSMVLSCLLGIFAVGSVMLFLVEPFGDFVNKAVTEALGSMGETNSTLLGTLLGGLMAVDMGGPITKAVYVFGASQLSVGNYGIMASVMTGGMVPPLAMFFATCLFRKKFSKEEKTVGIVNVFLGLSFITEGAIPFAATSPVAVVLSCAVGSALAGGLSAAFDCGIRASKGGIFVFSLVDKGALFLLALLVGSLVAAVLFGLLKKGKKWGEKS